MEKLGNRSSSVYFPFWRAQWIKFKFWCPHFTLHSPHPVLAVQLSVYKALFIQSCVSHTGFIYKKAAYYLHWILLRLERTSHIMKNNIPRFSGTSSNIQLDFACTAHYNFGRIISTEPHQDEITKVDDKHGMETILPKAKYFFISVSTSIFQVKNSEKVPDFLSKEIRLVTFTRSICKMKMVTQERPNSEFSTKVLSQ